MKSVGMVFVLPHYARQGVARALYVFVLHRGITLVSDTELTQGSRAIWRSLFVDPSISITMTRDILDMHEEPLSKIDMAFRQPDRRMIARLR